MCAEVVMAGALGARRLYRGVRRLVHPCVEGFFPVTYLPEEVRERKRRLDPEGLRQVAEANEATDRRVMRLASAVGIEARRAGRFLVEARKVRTRFADVTGDRGLASPMCFEDRYATYVVTRAQAPRSAVETGVGYGVSSLYILAGMEACGRGALMSVEILRDGRVGQLVPVALRGRWTLRFGDSLKVLPRVLEEAGAVDLFVHDSFHGYRHMWREFLLAWAHLRPGGLLVAHDVLENNAFGRFVRKFRGEIEGWSAGVNIGLVRKRR